MIWMAEADHAPPAADDEHHEHGPSLHFIRSIHVDHLQIKFNQIYFETHRATRTSSSSEKEKDRVNRTQRHDKPALTCDL